MEATFPDGKPLRVNREDFRRQFGASFPKLAGIDSGDATEASNIIDSSIDAVYDMFTGVATLWNKHDAQTYFDKTRRCYLYLAAWYIADSLPGGEVRRRGREQHEAAGQPVPSRVRDPGSGDPGRGRLWRG